MWIQWEKRPKIICTKKTKRKYPTGFKLAKPLSYGGEKLECKHKKLETSLSHFIIYLTDALFHWLGWKINFFFKKMSSFQFNSKLRKINWHSEKLKRLITVKIEYKKKTCNLSFFLKISCFPIYPAKKQLIINLLGKKLTGAEYEEWYHQKCVFLHYPRMTPCNGLPSSDPFCLQNPSKHMKSQSHIYKQKNSNFHKKERNPESDRSGNG